MLPSFAEANPALYGLFVFYIEFIRLRVDLRFFLVALYILLIPEIVKLSLKLCN